MIDKENLEIMNEIIEENIEENQEINKNQKRKVFLASMLGGIIGYKYL